MKYKVGDKVKVRSDLIANKRYGKRFGKYCFTDGMAKYKGRIVTIEKAYDGTYLIQEDGKFWYWTDKMFEEKVGDIDIEKRIEETLSEIKTKVVERLVNVIKEEYEKSKDKYEQEEQKEDVFPKEGEKFWLINAYGNIVQCVWTNSVEHRNALAFGNVYKTKEEAEFALEKLKVIAELKKFAEPKDRVWDEYNKHYYIGWDTDDNKFDIDFYHMYKKSIIYFVSEEKAKEAIKAVGEDRIKKYYLGVED